MVDGLIEAWCEFEVVHKGKRAASITKYRYSVMTFIEWARLNGKDVLEVSREDVANFLKYLFFDKDIKNNATRANKLSGLRAFFDYLIFAGVRTNNPAREIPSPRFRSKMPQKFTTEELQKLFGAPDRNTERGLRDLALLATIYGAGLRASEVCNLKFEDIADSGGYLRLKILDSKGAKSRAITLRKRPSKVLRQWMAARIAQGATKKDTVFISISWDNERKPLSTGGLNFILKQYAEVCGLRKADVFVHKLRSTFATDLYDVGRDKCAYCGRSVEKVDVLEISFLMGHNDPKTTMGYIAISNKVLQKTAIPDRRWRELNL